MKKSLYGVNMRLSLMMLFQYMMYAVWWVPLAAYLTNIGVSSIQKSLILSSMAIGCMASPIIGMIADRYFPSQKVLALLNLMNAVMLILAAVFANPDILFVALLLAMIFYMPSWSLTSAIALTHVSGDKFSRIRVFGSIGWVISGVFSIITVKVFNLDFDGTRMPFYYGAVISIFTSLFNLSLPDTPPLAKGQKWTILDVLGLRSLKLMKDKNFAAFIILSFLAMIPFSMYWSYCSEFLLNKGFKYISVTMNWGQFAEMFFLLTIPLLIRKSGLRITMITGLTALLVRNLSFLVGSGIDNSIFYFIGILLHGLIFGYFFLGGQIYINRKAPDDLRAQAQGLIFLVTFGLGLFVGNLISGRIISEHSSVMNNMVSYNWTGIWGITSILTLVILLSFLFFFKQEKEVVGETVLA